METPRGNHNSLRTDNFTGARLEMGHNRRMSRSLHAMAASLVALVIACGDDDGGRPTDAGTDSAPPPRDAGAEPEIVPPELADEDALARLAAWERLPVLGPGRYVQASSRELPGGEPVETRLLQNGNRDLNNFVCVGEGSDIDEPLLVPPVVAMETCPEPYVRGAVLARFEGSGRMTRLWMTTTAIRTTAPDRELLRIYVDDEAEPVVQVRLAAVLDGSAGEIFAPPFGAGASSHVAWHYPVVFGSKVIVTLDHLGLLDGYYHQIDVVLDATPIARRRAPAALPSRALARDALSPGDAPMGTSHGGAITVAPGAPVVALDLAGPGTIRELRLAVDEAALASLAGVRVDVRWDDAATPAIDVPVLDLFASMLDVPAENNRALGAASAAGRVESWLRFPMPFESRALVALTSEGDAPVDVALTAVVAAGVPDGAFGRLHVARSETVAPAPASAHPIASVTGPGRLAGVCFALEGHGWDDPLFGSPFNFLEGDERATIDGVVAIEGTGTEDYPDASFYFEDGTFATAFAAAWGVATDDTASPPRGRASFCRWHVLGDEVDFASSFEMSLEIGPGDATLLDRYRSVAYLYR